eukprot:c2813_g1_i1.p1 GENE.c2813_g1_i1~~c2813_g1_i1.p1  ORF type:complete len:478 (+),score=118.33 c2813_g1_i1:33-1436(+)
MEGKVVIVGGGLVGSLLAVTLAKRGFAVEVYERYTDPRLSAAVEGRSINLVLTTRGLRAVHAVGLHDVVNLCVPVKGRMMHSVSGDLTFQPYGQSNQWNNSVSRRDLNIFLLDAADKNGVKVHFEHVLTGIDVDSDPNTTQLTFQNGNQSISVVSSFVIGADGGGSVVRRSLNAQNKLVKHSEDLLEYGYKEMTFPTKDGKATMDRDSLHIWPRGSHMLMALADLQESFTGTIYLPRTGEIGFDTISSSPEKITEFFQTYYPDAIELLGGLDRLLHQWTHHPVGILGTVRCAPWNVGSKLMLIGDAAHGIVPFFGQGCNCGFEDILEFSQMLEKNGGDLAKSFAEFGETRKPNSDAIADLALENFVEMRDRVGDKNFLLAKKVEHFLEQSFPGKFRSRYALVVYSSVPYSTCKAVGDVIGEIVQELIPTMDGERIDSIDLAVAESLIEAKLTPFFAARGIDLAKVFD